MKLTTSILMIMLAASASAQQKPADQAAPVKSGTVNMAPAKPTGTQTKSAAAPAKAIQAAPAKAAPATKPVTTKAPAPKAKKAPVVAKKAKEPVKEAPKVEAKAKEASAEPEMEKSKRVAAFDRTKRDPFQTIVREHATSGGVCQGGGKQCLVPDEVALKGIVRSNGAIIAVVTTKDNRAYFLRENDPVLNGVVTRISEGSITFREKTTDIFGKTVMREVIKKINPAAA